MAKPTVVKITRLSLDGATVKTTDDKTFFVHSLSPMNGVLTITASSAGMSIHELSEIVSGCFEPDSTFEGVNWVTFTFGFVTVTVTSGEARNNPDYVVSKWEKAKATSLK